MNICGMEKISLVDYDGFVATTVFCCGCDFACPFCHNGGLVTGAHAIIPTQEVFDYLNQRKKLLDAVVVSGGEPTLQKDLIDFLKELKKFGLKIKLDTNGNHFETLQEIIQQKLVDYVAMDVKNSTKAYPATVGIPNFDLTNILKSIDLLKKGNVDYEFRTTLVKEFHTTATIDDMSRLTQNSKRLFLQKFKPTDSCICPNLTPVDKETALCFAEILRKTTAQVTLRGYE